MRIISITLLAASSQAFFNPRTFTANKSFPLKAVSEKVTELENGSYYKITSDDSGPNGSKVTKLVVKDVNETEELIFETGKIARQAAGSVTLSRGDTVLLSTTSRDRDPKGEIDFLPLSVEYQERFSSAGQTSGGYNKRDGRPAEHEILTCRLIDRPLRPLIANGWRHETQILTWVLSYDGLRSNDPLAIMASSASMFVSDVPLTKPVAAAMVGYVDGQYVLNPTNEQMAQSRLNLSVAGTKDAVLMIEGAADFLTEKEMADAVNFGHQSIKLICNALEAFGNSIGVEKKFDTIDAPIEGLQEAVNDLMTEQVNNAFAIHNKEGQSDEISRMSKFVVEQLEAEFPDAKIAIKGAFKELMCKRMYELAKNHSTRADGRKFDEVRPISIEAAFLPRAHGSALFTRGETQCLATTTLGDSSMRQKLEKLDGLEQKRFYLQYSFPPSCVGETGRVGAPGRREVGHGNLAERALVPIIPDEEDFPYTIRVESLITESHGSSSMASVCGGCLSLMDAGVPIKKSVAGIAMGMLLDDKAGVSDENAIVVSDILGVEDALGTMDFKVAGDRNGITTFQLDIKCEGLSLETMERALEQARQGRLHILDEMDKVLQSPRNELPDKVPRMGGFKIDVDSIGKVIGPGGKQIRAIIEDFELENMDVAEDGKIQLSAFNTTNISLAEEFVLSLVSGNGKGGKGGGGSKEDKGEYTGPPPEVGKIYQGKIRGIHNFGVFFEIMPGAEDGSSPGLEGLCHVSELHTERVRNCEGFMSRWKDDTETLFEVKVLGFNDRGKLQLSRKAAMLEKRTGQKGEGTNGSSSSEKIIKPQPDIEGLNKAEEAIITAAIEEALDIQ